MIGLPIEVLPYIRRMQLAAKNGSLTPEVVMEMLRQLTKQKALNRKSMVE